MTGQDLPEGSEAVTAAASSSEHPEAPAAKPEQAVPKKGELEPEDAKSEQDAPCTGGSNELRPDDSNAEQNAPATEGKETETNSPLDEPKGSATEGQQTQPTDTNGPLDEQKVSATEGQQTLPTDTNGPVATEGQQTQPTDTNGKETQSKDDKEEPDSDDEWGGWSAEGKKAAPVTQQGSSNGRAADAKDADSDDEWGEWTSGGATGRREQAWEGQKQASRAHARASDVAPLQARKAVEAAVAASRKRPQSQFGAPDGPPVARAVAVAAVAVLACPLAVVQQPRKEPQDQDAKSEVSDRDRKKVSSRKPTKAPRLADTAESAAPASAAGISHLVEGTAAQKEEIKQWLANLDQGKGALNPFLPVLQTKFCSLDDILQAAFCKSEVGQNSSMLDSVSKAFFADLGVTSLGHRLLFAKGIQAARKLKEPPATALLDSPQPALDMYDEMQARLSRLLPDAPVEQAALEPEAKVRRMTNEHWRLPISSRPPLPRAAEDPALALPQLQPIPKSGRPPLPRPSDLFESGDQDEQEDGDDNLGHALVGGLLESDDYEQVDADFEEFEDGQADRMEDGQIGESFEEVEEEHLAAPVGEDEDYFEEVEEDSQEPVPVPSSVFPSKRPGG
ncbi:unnamed protein product [Polarella glacialis]|uniref:SAM domain-containing protein n=1 Tax=Polarella glacialis TaxID=89957 RepID=A0A813E2N0_POLGL|nr:unnamed protein product [Polarella glacialis]